LLEEAQKLGGKKTKKDTVNEALVEYIQRRKQKEIVSLFGKVDYEDNHDYKKEILDEGSRRYVCMVACIKTQA